SETRLRELLLVSQYDLAMLMPPSLEECSAGCAAGAGRVRLAQLHERDLLADARPLSARRLARVSEHGRGRRRNHRDAALLIAEGHGAASPGVRRDDGLRGAAAGGVGEGLADARAGGAGGD